MRSQKIAVVQPRFRAQAGLLSLCFVLAGVRPAKAQQAPAASRLEHADKEPQNWMTYYGNYSGWSYSPLDQISRKNVKQLVPVWAFAAGAPPLDSSLRPGLMSAPL